MNAVCLCLCVFMFLYMLFCVCISVYKCAVCVFIGNAKGGEHTIKYADIKL